MDALQLVESLHPTSRIRELAAGANKVFRVTAADNTSTSIVKVYPVASRERRERRALEALTTVEGVPRILDSGVEGEMAWIQMNDAGGWNLSSLPRNDDTLEAAGHTLRNVHSAAATITNLALGIDSEYVQSHFRSTVERLERFLGEL